jgi:hypothetical protein
MELSGHLHAATLYPHGRSPVKKVKLSLLQAMKAQRIVRRRDNRLTEGGEVVCLKSHMTWPGIEPGPPRWEGLKSNSSKKQAWNRDQPTASTQILEALEPCNII